MLHLLLAKGPRSKRGERVAGFRIWQAGQYSLTEVELKSWNRNCALDSSTERHLLPNSSRLLPAFALLSLSVTSWADCPMKQRALTFQSPGLCSLICSLLTGWPQPKPFPSPRFHCPACNMQVNIYSTLWGGL